MILNFRTKWFKLRFVFRHRWEKKLEHYESFRMRNNYELGLWLKTYKAVGNAKGTLKFIFSDDNHVRGYMLGLNLIVCKMWVDISGPTLELGVDKTKK
jgi:hypothetical protein